MTVSPSASCLACRDCPPCRRRASSHDQSALLHVPHFPGAPAAMMGIAQILLCVHCLAFLRLPRKLELLPRHPTFNILQHDRCLPFSAFHIGFLTFEGLLRISSNFSSFCRREDQYKLNLFTSNHVHVSRLYVCLCR